MGPLPSPWSDPALPPPRRSAPRLLADLEALAAVGDTGDGGNCRLALTDDDAGGRELVVGWMRELGLDVRVDRIGNVVATRAGADDGAGAGHDRQPHRHRAHRRPLRRHARRAGRAGGRALLDDAGVRTRRPLAVAFFTDEEGSRFAPDMLGRSSTWAGWPLEDALDVVGIDGAVLGEELERIGWAGDAAVPGPAPHAFVELHIEQGPVLEEEGVAIGAVTGVQGISWEELTLTGQSNHAGTTPMRLRHDPGLVAAEVARFVRQLARELGGHQVGTVGRLGLHPDLVNVVAARAVMTVDLRNTDDAVCREAEARVRSFDRLVAADEGVTVERRSLARFAPVEFDPTVVSMVADAAEAGARRAAHALGRRPRRPDAGPGVPHRHGVRPPPAA